MSYRENLIAKNLNIDEKCHLTFAGVDTLDLAKEYGTPTYFMDEDRIREMCNIYKSALKDAFGEKGRAIYASKAASFKQMYRIMNEEEMFCDVVSIGEINTAIKAGFPPERLYFHSNNKTDYDIEFALKNNIGYFVIDNTEELIALDRISGELSKKAQAIIRVTPGIDTHTFEAVSTGKVDSKFGFAIETGAAEDITKLALSMKNINLLGFHCHVGSQLFDSDVYIRSAKIMLEFILHIKETFGFCASMLDLGGGYGVKYKNTDPDIDIYENILEVGDFVKSFCSENGIEMPQISFEPGRSIVADAGLTLYTVGNVKKIPGFINYVSCDGGMADNVRYAMYEAPYTVLPAGKMLEDEDLIANVVGRCCESGDIIQPSVLLPQSTKRGDIIAVCTTGAYNYSMASNYNRLPRPAVVMIKNGATYVAVRGETLDDLLNCDI